MTDKRDEALRIAEEALRPFGDMYDLALAAEDGWPDYENVDLVDTSGAILLQRFTVSQFRNAAKALAAISEAKDAAAQ